MTARKVLSFDWILWFQWIMATAWGWILGSLLFAGIYLAAAGVTVAVFQWVILRSHLRGAWRWLPASIIGWGVGTGLAFALGQLEPSFVTGSLLGSAVGLAQWLILRREVRWAGWWIAISVVGWSTGMSMALAPLLAGVLAGAMTGIALLLLPRMPKAAQPNQARESL